MTSTVKVGNERFPLSAWHVERLRPWEAGVYQRAKPAGPYACWNGSVWLADSDTPAKAAAQNRVSSQPAALWRGLAVPAGRPCTTCKGHTVIDRGSDINLQIDQIGECPDC